MFAPEIGASVLAQREWCNSDFAVMCVLFDLPDAHGKLSVGDFERARLQVDPYADDTVLVQDKLQEIINLMPKLFSHMLAAQAQMTRQFRIFQLAAQTYRANWQTAWKLQWREREDARQVTFSSAGECVPLCTWKERVTAALIACHQQDGLTKDGALLGPVWPQTVSAAAAGPAVAALPYTLRPRAQSRHAKKAWPHPGPTVPSAYGSCKVSSRVLRSIPLPLPSPALCAAPRGSATRRHTYEV